MESQHYLNLTCSIYIFAKERVECVNLKERFGQKLTCLKQLCMSE